MNTFPYIVIPRLYNKFLGTLTSFLSNATHRICLKVWQYFLLHKNLFVITGRSTGWISYQSTWLSFFNFNWCQNLNHRSTGWQNKLLAFLVAWFGFLAFTECKLKNIPNGRSFFFFRLHWLLGTMSIKKSSSRYLKKIKCISSIQRNVYSQVPNCIKWFWFLKN